MNEHELSELLKRLREPYEKRKKECSDYVYTLPGLFNPVMGQYCINSSALEKGTSNCDYNCKHGYCPLKKEPLPNLRTGLTRE